MISPSRARSSRPLIPNHRLPLLLAGFAAGTMLTSAGSAGERYAGLTLEELLDVRVTTPSVKSQRVSEAPAIISTVSRRDIERLGIQTLPELFDYIPGFNVYDNYWKPSMISARGAKMPLYNNKILMLINGIPAYDAMALEYYLNSVPLGSIERVEVIRGPGSTLYGTGAYSAVINVITRTGEELDPSTSEAQASLKVGSLGTREARLAVSSHGEAARFHLGAFFRNDDGYRTDILDEQGVVGPVVLEDDIETLFASGSFGDLTVTAGLMNARFGKFGPLPRHSTGSLLNERDGRTEHRKLFAQLSYEAELGERWDSKLYLRYDDSDMNAASGRIGVDVYQSFLGVIPEDVAVPIPVYYRQAGTVLQGEAQLSYRLSDQARLLTGFNAETRRITRLGDIIGEPRSNEVIFPGSTRDLPLSTTDFGAYVQVDGRWGKVGYVLGVRSSYLDISQDSFITPRAGLVIDLDRGRSLKILYGEAFRGASPNEQFFQLPGVIYGRDAVGDTLDPERIRTAEIAWDQILSERYRFRLNVFYNDLRDVIIRDATTERERSILGAQAGTLGRIYRNAFEAELVGFEAEIFGYPNDHLEFFANVSYKEDREGNYEFVEDYTASAGLSYQRGRWALRPNVLYVGEKSGTVRGSEAVTIDGYTLFNLVVDVELTDRLTARFEGRNLADEEYFFPEDVRQNIARIPGGPGRTLFFSLSYGVSF